MADNTATAGVDLNTLFTQAITGGGGATLNVSGASLDDLKKLDDNMKAVSTAVQGQMVVQAGLQKADDINNTALMSTLMQGASLQQAAGVASGNISAAKVNATNAESATNQAVAGYAGLTQTGALTDRYDSEGHLTGTTDTRSVLYKSIDDFNLAKQHTAALIDAAEHQAGIGLLDVFRGSASLGEWWDAKVVNPPEDYIEKAKLEMQQAGNSADQIEKLTGFYDGAAKRNAAAFEGLKLGSSADNATLASAVFNDKATQLQASAYINNAQNIQSNMGNSKSIQTVAISQGEFTAKSLNFERMAMAWGARMNPKTNPEEYTAAVKAGAKAMGVVGYENVSPAMIVTMLNNPEEKAKLDGFVDLGIRVASSSAVPADQPTPNMFSTPGAAWTLMNSTGGHLVGDASAPITKWLNTVAAGTDSFNGKTLNSKGREEYINRKAGDAWNNIKDNLADDPTFGQVSMQAVLAHAAFNTPDMAKYKSILQPLVSNDKPVNTQLLMEAVYRPDNGLTSEDRVKLLTTYGKTAAQQVDMLRRPTQISPNLSVQRNGFTAKLGTHMNLFGNPSGITPVNLSDEASVRTYDTKRMQAARIYSAPNNDAAY